MTGLDLDPPPPPPPLFRRQDTDIPAWYWTGLTAGGSIRNAVTGFAGSGPGVKALMSDPVGRLGRAVPEVGLVGEPAIIDWGADPLAGGCYSVIGPGQRALLDVFRRPWGRVVIAGEHCNGSGSIDGAIRSGDDAAAQVLSLRPLLRLSTSRHSFPRRSTISRHWQWP